MAARLTTFERQVLDIIIARPRRGKAPVTARELSEQLGGKPQGESFIACCPAHADSRPSLKIAQGEGKILIYCWAGCKYTTSSQRLGWSIRTCSTEMPLTPTGGGC